jgi:carbonic anhydrase
VRDLLVMGHALCGGIRALLTGVPPEAGDFVAAWIRLAEPVRARALADSGGVDVQLCCEWEAVKLSLANLATFPWIRDAVSAGRLRLHGAHFDIRSGVLSRLGPDGRFTPVDATPAPL